MVKQETLYKLCDLSRETRDGKYVDVAWIPEKFAAVGRVIGIKNADGEWVEGWRVDTTSENSRPGSYLNERSRDHCKTRDASDI